MPFTDALDLVRNRRVFLKRGFAYVPHSELVVIILSQFRSDLSRELVITARVLPALEEENRLMPLLNAVSKCYVGNDFTNQKTKVGQITADMIDMV